MPEVWSHSSDDLFLLDSDDFSINIKLTTLPDDHGTPATPESPTAYEVDDVEDDYWKATATLAGVLIEPKVGTDAKGYFDMVSVSYKINKDGQVTTVDNFDNIVEPEEGDKLYIQDFRANMTTKKEWTLDIDYNYMDNTTPLPKKVSTSVVLTIVNDYTQNRAVFNSLIDGTYVFPESEET